MTRSIRSLLDLTAEQIDHLLNRAIELKARRRQGILDQPLAGKTLGLLFDKASTRTRVSFETAMAQLGGTPLYIQADTTQI
ncbi:MAG: ornithine carbamoyltransferase, partial [Thermodesulfobacteriota bacterium]